jgi:hypothetical protein
MPYSSIEEAAIADGANLTPPLATSNVNVSLGTDADGNSTVKVTVTYTFTTFTKYPGIPNQVTLVQSVEMRSAT